MLTFLDDLRYGLRTLRKQPGIALIAVLTFTLGIGLTASMFGIVRGALRGLPFEDSERLMHLERSRLSEGIESMEVTLQEYLAWRERQTSFEGLAGFYMGTANLASPGQPPERYDAAFLTANSFDLLREDAALGRTLAADEEGPASPAVAILGWHVWQKRFGGDPGIVGKTLRINAKPTEILGVMPEGFRFPLNQDLWMPLTLDPAKYPWGGEDQRTLEIFGRLKDGVSADQAAQEMARITQQIAEEHPDTNEGVSSIVQPYTHEWIGDQPRNLLLTMLGAVIGVLLIACVNVANLLLARTVQRSKEVAVRSALGASRWRVVTQLLTETLVLATLGSALGLVFTVVGMKIFGDIIDSTNPPFWIRFDVDGLVLAFTVGVTLLAALAAGLVPALQASGERVGEVLKDETRGGSSGFRLGRFSKGLVVTEIALTCGLLVGAGLMIQSVVKLRTVDWGFPTEEVLTARIGLFEEDYPEVADRRRFYEQLQTRLEALPGVEHAAFTQNLPILGAGRTRFEIEGEAYARPEERPLARQVIVTPGFFDAFRVSLLQGRDFGLQDREDGLPVVIVNQDLATKLFPGQDPVGKRLRLASDTASEGEGPEEPWRTVIGVVPGMYLGGVDNEDPEGLYLPLAQTDARFLSLAALARGGDPLDLAPQVRAEVQALDPNLPIYWVDTMAGAMHQRVWFYDVFGALFMILGFTAFFLAVVGLYGVMSFAVTRRTHEVGVRMALGAKTRDVLRLILRQGMVQLAVGLTIGLGLALVFSKLLELVLFEVEPWNPTNFALIAAVLALAGLTACWVPARRAAKVDPVTALRG